MIKWEYKNLQFQTELTIGLWSKISKEDLNKLERLQNNGWEVFQCEFVKPSPEVSEDYRRKNNGNH